MPRVRLSLRSQLRAFTIGVCLVIVAMNALTTGHAHAVAVDVARRATENLATSLAREASDTMEAADGAVADLVERVEAEGLSPNARTRLRDAMSRTIIAMPRLHELLLVDEHGSLILDNTSAAGVPNLNFSDQEYFRYHRTHAIPTAFISGPFRSKIENRWVIAVTRRIDRADGGFAGVAVAQISLDYFERTYGSVDIGPLGVIDLVRDNGTILVRKPLVKQYVGRSVLGSAVFNGPLRYAASGSFVTRSIVDGVRRLYGFARADRYPLVVIVALGERDYLASWKADTLVHLIATVAIVISIIGLGMILATQITQRKRAEDSLTRLAMLDALTEIANRRQFDDTLERHWLQAVRERSSLALLMIDADHFKIYNDTFGHQRGDELLKVVAATIVENIRPSDLGARYGGEEFAVILPMTDVETAFKVAERIRIAVAAGTLSDPDAMMGITISVGVASIRPTPGVDRSVLIAATDRALYEAKHAGRDRCVAENPLGPFTVALG